MPQEQDSDFYLRARKCIEDAGVRDLQPLATQEGTQFEILRILRVYADNSNREQGILFESIANIRVGEAILAQARELLKQKGELSWREGEVARQALEMSEQKLELQKFGHMALEDRISGTGNAIAANEQIEAYRQESTPVADLQNTAIIYSPQPGRLHKCPHTDCGSHRVGYRCPKKLENHIHDKHTLGYKRPYQCGFGGCQNQTGFHTMGRLRHHRKSHGTRLLIRMLLSDSHCEDDTTAA
jgi:hypothetical protein